LLQSVEGGTHAINTEGLAGSHKYQSADDEKVEHEKENEVESDLVRRIGTWGPRRWGGLRRSDWQCRRRKRKKPRNDGDGDDDEWARREVFEGVG